MTAWQNKVGGIPSQRVRGPSDEGPQLVTLEACHFLQLYMSTIRALQFWGLALHELPNVAYFALLNSSASAVTTAKSTLGSIAVTIENDRHRASARG